MKDIRKTIQTVCRKNIVVIIMIVFLCPILAITYATFITNTEDYKASEMYIGDLLYSLKINNNLISSITVEPGETEVKVEVTSLNSVSSNYKLTYTTNPNITVMYAEDDNEPTEGLITTTKTSTLLIQNNSLSDITVSFNIIGGYSTNNLSEIEIPNTESEILTDYTKFDYNTVTMYVNGTRVESLNSNLFYDLSTAVCSNDEEVEWDSISRNITIKNITNQTKCQLYFISKNPTIKEKMLRDNTPINDKNLVFNTPSSISGDLGLYYTNNKQYTEDIDGDGAGEKVYYYRGAVTNNYLVFANYCWRIMRTNETGGVRLRYGGTPTISNGITTCLQTGQDVYTHVDVVFNEEYNDNRYVGYMYGNTCDTYEHCHTNDQPSDMKELLETWYANNIKTNYNSYVEDAIYCNDRTINTNEGPYYGLTNEQKGFGSYITFYGATARLMGTSLASTWNGAFTAAHPSYRCIRNDDKFSMSNTIGNGENIEPIGLITADEISYAGGEWFNADNSSTNATYYLYTGKWYWAMSASCFYWNNSRVFHMNTTGSINYSPINNTTGRVLPVISLKNTVTISSGNGAYNNPYMVQ